MSKYSFWTHGTDVQIEYPERIKGNPQRAGWGTKIFQDSSFNWFHFAIPTPTELGDRAVLLSELYFDVKLGPENVRITDIHIREGAGNILKGVAPSDLGPGTKTSYKIGISRKKITKSVVLSLKVVFKRGTPTAWIIFECAGARFKKTRIGALAQ